MKIKKMTIQILIGAAIMFSFFPVGLTPTVEFGQFGFLQGGLAVGLFFGGFFIMIHATINDIYNLNERKHYFYVLEGKTQE